MADQLPLWWFFTNLRDVMFGCWAGEHGEHPKPS